MHLGPADAKYSYIPPNPQPDGLGYNPRCLIRDVSQYVTSRWTKDSDIYDLITGYTNITSFQRRLQGDFPIGYLGIHSGGHYTILGDPGGDFFASPGDPYFFIHREWIRCSKYLNQCALMHLCSPHPRSLASQSFSLSAYIGLQETLSFSQFHYSCCLHKLPLFINPIAQVGRTHQSLKVVSTYLSLTGSTK